ncbi:hypothetical protein BS50DRAFT_629030 [Corynespora cassiicola Philippines]|uniref:FAM192A/Fyv6 N-terminal domain-containing protein n=1 Tax=Corynespora cassiicola Philippines TaxID=1448308 RepID=A0A2T2P5H1_CORCC|nr:hypothetical protein BS50DRAFT_629030 [Corynespora cassiicola Philippines]
MSSGFVSGGTVDEPTERDDAWREAQAEIERKHLEKQQQAVDNGGKSLYEVLQDNKAKKQEAFEEATRLKNQYRALDDSEAEFLDSVLESTRKKEAAVKKETLEQLDLFRKQQEEAERKALEDQTTGGPKEDASQWIASASARKRKKGPENTLLKGIKLRKANPTDGEKSAATKAPREATQDKSSEVKKSPVAEAKASPPNKAAVPLSKPVNPLALGLGYASSDDDDD